MTLSFIQYDYIKRPIITEKSHILNEQSTKKKYIFEVHRLANKHTIARAILDSFGAEVDSVNIINVLGKKKRTKGIIGKRSDKKKAIVTLKVGHNINMLNDGV